MRKTTPDVKEQIRDRKKFLFCSALWFFLSGVEYAIVIPTAHAYCSSLGGADYFIGIVIASLSFGAMLAAPVFAKVTDKLLRAKTPIRIGMIFSIVGGLIYTFIQNKYVVVVARFIAGIGWGLEGAFMGQIGRTFSMENKTSRFALVLMMRQFGVVLGPVLIFGLKLIDFSVEVFGYSIHVTEYSAPGLVMALLWFCAWLAMWLIYVDPVPEENGQAETTAVTSVTDSLLQIQEISSEALTSPLSERDAETSVPNAKYRYTSPTGLLHEPIIVVASCTFSTYVLQSGMETLFTPFTHHYLGWTIQHNAVLYMIIGTVAFLGYVSMQVVSKKLDERVTLLTGCISLTCVLITVMCVYPNLTFRAQWIYPVFGLSLMIFCWFLPYVVVSAAGLLSKLAPEHLQSRAQTVRTVTEVMAQVLSPFWTGYMQHSRYAVLVFQLTFMSICTLLTILSWKFLKPSDFIQYKKDRSIVRENGMEMENGLEK